VPTVAIVAAAVSFALLAISTALAARRAVVRPGTERLRALVGGVGAGVLLAVNWPRAHDGDLLPDRTLRDRDGVVDEIREHGEGDER
jgi:hypothetical protein